VIEATVAMIQIDGPKRQVFIHFVEFPFVQDVLQRTKGLAEYKHSNGDISKVRIEVAGMGTKRVRIANLPPEIREGKIRAELAYYGEIRDIQEEKWSKAYRYVVANGIRIVMITLKQHIPSHLTITGHRVLASYEGQPITCYGCGDNGHLYQVRPRRRNMGKTDANMTTKSWADIAAGAEQPKERRDEET
jgi:hypothetical protein